VIAYSSHILQDLFIEGTMTPKALPDIRVAIRLLKPTSKAPGTRRSLKATAKTPGREGES
jgi:hypothetical protein